MTADQYRATIDKLGLSQQGAGRFLNVGERTARRYATGESEIPTAVSRLLLLMVHFKLTADGVLTILTPDPSKKRR
jgi:hypothetical protein